MSCKKQQVKSNTMHCTNINHETVVLLYLVQLSIIVFFFTLKDKFLPSLHSMSRERILPSVTIIIDSALCYVLIYLLSRVSTLSPLLFLILVCRDTQPRLLIMLLKIYFLSILSFVFLSLHF